jgi:hypothetical protein
MADLLIAPANRPEKLTGIKQGNTALLSTTSGGFISNGEVTPLVMRKSPIITRGIPQIQHYDWQNTSVTQPGSGWGCKLTMIWILGIAGLGYQPDLVGQQVPWDITIVLYLKVTSTASVR